MNDNLVFKDVDGFEKRYAVTQCGQVFNKDLGRFMKQFQDAGGYPKLVLNYKGKRRGVKIHRLVCEAFHPNPENKPCVNHKDAVRTNNHFSNLEWCTYSENTKHSIKLGLSNLTPVHINKFKEAGSKEVMQIDLQGNIIAVFKSLAEASRVTKINDSTISHSTRYAHKTAGGYRWVYVGDASFYKRVTLSVTDIIALGEIKENHFFTGGVKGTDRYKSFTHDPSKRTANFIDKEGKVAWVSLGKKMTIHYPENLYANLL